ncbi:MAG TPA: type II/IV secretion system protein [Candidatus Uhrbacteria bacterium]|nr:type II/IV secretion system protein [Candidatus Uhrbacteria bacterium]
MLNSKKLRQILVEPGYIKEPDFQAALKEAKKEKLSLEEVLVNRDLIANENFGRLVADARGFKYIDLARQAIKPDILRLIPEVAAKTQLVIAFAKDKEGLKIAMNNPLDLQMQHFLAKKTGDKIIVYYATKKDILKAIKLYRKELKAEFSEIILEHLERIKTDKDDKLPIIKIVESIITYAYENRASDIHIEPFEKNLLVRFRVDGVLHDVLDIPKNFHELMVSRIKIMANLRTDEHKAAQDGKLQFNLPQEKLDIRVSVIPIVAGEKVVLRLLSKKLKEFNLENLNIDKKPLKKIQEAIKKPWGMILATGPTGCGKTTTLYAILKKLNTREVNISTIEDPVEYDIEGINQIQINEETNLTFAKGLRSILRQDPDIIMVGEIRDEETAKIALNASMTGHLLLSTLHTNDAAAALPRLLDLKTEPFLAASSILIIIAQRLVRKICPNCIKSYNLSAEEFLKAAPEASGRKFINKKEKLTLYKGVGCKLCHKTGYAGRLGIFEVLPVSPKIADLITARAASQQIKKQAMAEGMQTMLEDGLAKAFLGLTTLEEILRVTKE